MDKENDVMVINVSPHHGHIESKTIYDMKSVSLNSIHDYRISLNNVWGH